MKNNFKESSLGILLFFIFAFIVTMVLYQPEWDRKSIVKWCEANNYTLVEHRPLGIFESSPFWRMKNTRIYKATVMDKDHFQHVSWFRCGSIFGIEQIWEHSNAED